MLGYIKVTGFSYSTEMVLDSYYNSVRCVDLMLLILLFWLLTFYFDLVHHFVFSDFVGLVTAMYDHGF